MNVVENISWLEHFSQSQCGVVVADNSDDGCFGNVSPLSPNAKLVGAFTSVMGVCLCRSAPYLHCWHGLYQADFEAK